MSSRDSQNNISGTEQWSFRVEGEFFSSFTVGDGTLYICSSNNLYAVDAATGTEEWAFDTGGEITSAPIVGDGMVYVSSHKYLHALDATTGTEEWTSKPNMGPIAVVNGILHASMGGSWYALDAATGSKKWSFDTDSIGIFHSTIVNETVYIGGKKLYAVDVNTGAEIWVFDPGDVVRYSPTVVDETVYIGVISGLSHDIDNFLFAVDGATGTLEWAYDAGASAVKSRPTVWDNRIYVGSFQNDHMYAVDAATGTELWTFETDVNGRPTVVDGTIYLMSNTNKLYAVDAATGTEKWAFDDVKEPTNSHPTVENGTVYVRDLRDSCLYAVDAATGTKEWSLNDILDAPTVADGTVYIKRKNPGNMYAITASTESENSSHQPPEPSEEKQIANDLSTQYISSVAELMRIKAQHTAEISEVVKYAHELEESLEESDIAADTFENIVSDFSNIVSRLEDKKRGEELDEERMTQIENVTHRIERLCQRNK